VGAVRRAPRARGREDPRGDRAPACGAHEVIRAGRAATYRARRARVR
jgi:hypothetical protein